MPRIATLMACHNRKAKTLRCLDALFQNLLPYDCSLDVFLVDDGSTDGTTMAVNEKYPNVNIISGNGKLFWNRGMHEAWQTASLANSYDYYLWLNDDTDIFPQAVNLMLKAAETTNNSAVIVAPTCSKVTGELTYSGFQHKGKSSSDLRVEPTGKLVAVDYFCGNCVLVPKRIWEKVGPLDPLFHHSLGDFDYGFRVSKAGFKSFLAPEYLAYCEQHDTLPKWCLPSVPLTQRFLTLYSPLGHCHPYHLFRYEFRHFGLVVALKHLFSVNLRMLFPQLWKNKQ